MRRDLVLASLILLLLWGVLAAFGPIGWDFATYYRPTARAFLSGHTHLYDATSRGYFAAPHTLLLLIPLSLLPLRWGSAALAVFNLVALLWSAAQYTRNRAILLLALATPFTAALILDGQLDGLVLAGVVLATQGIQQRRPGRVSAGLLLMGMKPINVVFPALVLLMALRSFEEPDRIKALAWPLAALVLPSIVIGVDWPLRYAQNVMTAPPERHFVMPLWKVLTPSATAVLAVWLGATALQRVSTHPRLDESIALALAVGLALSPYAHDGHFVLLIPAFCVLSDVRRGLIGLYGLVWLPVAHAVGVAPDVIYPVILAGLLLIVTQPTVHVLRPVEERVG